MKKKLLVGVLVVGIAVVAAKFCCPGKGPNAALVAPVAQQNIQYTSEGLSSLRADALGAAVVRPAGLKAVLTWAQNLQPDTAKSGLERIVLWVRERIQLVKILQSATESFDELIIGVAPKMVSTSTGYKFPVFGSIWSHSSEESAQKLLTSILEKKGVNSKTTFNVVEEKNGVYSISVAFADAGNASGKMWRKGNHLYIVVGGESEDLFDSSAKGNSRFAKISEGSVSDPLVTLQFDPVNTKKVLDGLFAGVEAYAKLAETLKNYENSGFITASAAVTGNAFRSRICGEKLEIDPGSAGGAEASRFGNLLGDGTVLAYRANERMIKGFVDSVLLASRTIQGKEAQNAIPDAATSDLSVSAKRGEELAKIIKLLLPPKAEVGLVVEMPMGGFTPMVMGYMRAEGFKAEEFLRTGAGEINSRITQNFGDYRLSAKAFDRDGIPYINFLMDGESQPVFLRAAGSDGLAIGISEVSVDQAVARLVSGENLLAKLHDSSGMSLWERVLKSPGSTYLNFAPAVRILRPFLPFVVGDGERLPQGVTPEDVDYIVQNLSFKIIGTGAEFKAGDTQCRESLWEAMGD